MKMEEIKTKEAIFKQNINEVLSTLKSKPNRHCSVLNQTRLFVHAPMVRRCRKTQYECFTNINKKQIFTLVHKFIVKILKCEQNLNYVLTSMKFESGKSEQLQKNEKSNHSNILAQKPLNTCPIQLQQGHLSFQMLEQNLLKSKPKCPKPGKSCKKISIMFDYQLSDIPTQNQGSQLFSDQTISLGISSIEIQQHEFTLGIVEQIYEQPQPFLINLSVCLLLKYLCFSKTKLCEKNVCWILSIGTIIAYKIYYDETVQGLVDSFASILNVTRDDIVSLERNFLAAIDHEAIISNEQYHTVLYQIIKQETK